MVGGGEEENLLCEGLQRKNMSTSRVRRRRKWKNDEEACLNSRIVLLKGVLKMEID